MPAIVVWTLRQRRYRAMLLGMLVLAGICVAAGTWQVQRFAQSVHDNRILRSNARAAAVPLTTALVPLVGPAPAPGRDAIRFRTVTVTGQYLVGQQYLTGQSANGVEGFDVVTPLQTPAGLLLVTRGFAGPDAAGNPPAAAAPPGTVTITGRLQTADSAADKAGRLPHDEIAAINPAQQAARRGVPVFAASLALVSGQPGSGGLIPLSEPDLSNPAGGVVAPQHFAYIVQWYLFALLALAAPFAMGRHEVREARARLLGLDPGERQFDDVPAEQQRVPPALPGAASTSGASAELVPRERADLAVTTDPAQRVALARGQRLADRYGRSFGPGPVEGVLRGPLRRRRSGRTAPGLDPQVAGSRERPHRSADGYQGSYNDYLWQLALADGERTPAPPDAGGPKPAGGSAPANPDAGIAE